MVRITATGVLYTAAGAGWAEAVFHDLSGWLMMPLALGLLWLELQALARIFVEPAPASPIGIGLAGTRPARLPPPATPMCGHRRPKLTRH